MAEIKFITPFADVKILIEQKDEWAKEEIEDWICHKCGVPSQRDIQITLTKFEQKLEEVRNQSNSR